MSTGTDRDDFPVGTRVITDRFTLTGNASVCSRETATVVGGAGLGWLVEFADGHRAGAFPSEMVKVEFPAVAVHKECGCVVWVFRATDTHTDLCAEHLEEALHAF